MKGPLVMDSRLYATNYTNFSFHDISQGTGTGCPITRGSLRILIEMGLKNNYCKLEGFTYLALL
jgi:hypothetical protein